MRVAVAAALLLLSACATDGLKLAPPSDVNLTGRWELNGADSDDPQHLLQTANQAAAAANDPDVAGGRTSGRQGGGRGGRGGGVGYPALTPPALPAIAILNEAVRWPGKKLEIKQVAGVVAFTTDGGNRVCQPGDKRAGHHGGDHDHRPSGRDVPPPLCGWIDKTLIVQGGDPDDDRPPYEESFSLADNGKRLVQLIAFRGGRSNGFTLSRVWDLVPDKVPQ
jgi:hypothetical protein